MTPETAKGPADSVAQFAADLRRLKLDAGGPTLARLQSETRISRTVISEAFAGRQLPSERTVAALVRVLGEEPTEWLARRERLSRLKLEPEASEAGAEKSSSRHVSRRGAFLLGAVSFATGALLTGLIAVPVALTITGGQHAAAADVPQILVQTGEDPALTECVDDARVATGDTRADNSLLEIVWSDKCQAGWGRITRYDGLYQGNTVTIAIYPQTAPDGPDRQEATEHDVQGAYTTLVVRPSSDTLLCAEGSFTVAGKRVDLGEPLCI
jgi:hypothetical protein